MAFSFSNPFLIPTEVSTSVTQADTSGTTDSQTLPAIPSPTTPPTTKLTPIPIPSSSTSKWSISTSNITPPPPDPPPLPIISSITTLASLTNSSTWLTPLPIASSTPTPTPLPNSSTSLLMSISSASVTYSQSSSSSSIGSFSGSPGLHKSGSKSLIHNKGVIAGVSTFIALIVIIVIIILIKITIRRRRSKDSDNREEGEQETRTNSRSSEFIGNDIGDDGGGGYDEAFRDHLYPSPSTQLKPGRSDAFHGTYDQPQARMGYYSELHGARGVDSDDLVHESEEEGSPPYDYIGCTRT
ncbi:hypothetical protein C8Q75DRAFT_486001 [Abortiporus biennis]|nr:hypothetical protein C8Q75DRAFT_486001 [Abortiporus biennis]